MVTLNAGDKMNIFNYALRYLLTLANANWEEAYWDQVELNERWFKAVESIRERSSAL